MSGGSFNYLTPDNYHEQRSDLTAMKDELWRLVGKGVPGAEDAYRQMTRLDTLLYLSDLLAKDLETVWHAVEWRESGDWGDDQLREALLEYAKRLR